MRRAFPWILTAIFFVAFVASYSELQRVRKRFGEVTQHSFHDHAEVREFMIRAALADAPNPIVVLGDSITEMAPLPRQLCGHPVVNAGVGGQTIQEARRLTQRLVNAHGAYLIALTIGANDVGSRTVQRDFADLIETARPLSARPLVAVAVAPDTQTNRKIGEAATAAGLQFVVPQLPLGSKMPDGIHFTAEAYKVWIPAIEAAISKQCAT
ncbi:SGNH/GDSL hydrolase family protein [Bradyrhizobium genosp. L]|uniref:SGNH/GDSL hydrolase family protein n=1 Tax=Bradyrhizobium genosp. L TaxID=83637 RepID=UPI0018A2AB88|nr:SGNH/GDSL hydrolase family protein [Bradyrhizobium genosp. L]QPF83918.1 SGNH/GDSL hydrolase family protein [Bradyrhizobium genosp. L]